MVKHRKQTNAQNNVKNMKCLLLGMWTWALLVLMGSGRSMGCLEEERNALLNIEAAIYPLNGSSFLLWRDNNSDCCYWKGVECNYTTSRVIGLYLGDRDHSEWEARCGKTRESRPWDIDASLFLPLEELQVLDLSRNLPLDRTLLSGYIHTQMIEVWPNSSTRFAALLLNVSNLGKTEANRRG